MPLEGNVSLRVGQRYDLQLVVTDDGSSIADAKVTESVLALQVTIQVHLQVLQ